MTVFAVTIFLSAGNLRLSCLKLFLGDNSCGKSHLEGLEFFLGLLLSGLTKFFFRSAVSFHFSESLCSCFLIGFTKRFFLLHKSFLFFVNLTLFGSHHCESLFLSLTLLGLDTALRFLLTAAGLKFCLTTLELFVLRLLFLVDTNLLGLGSSFRSLFLTDFFFLLGGFGLRLLGLTDCALFKLRCSAACFFLRFLCLSYFLFGLSACFLCGFGSSLRLFFGSSLCFLGSLLCLFKLALDLFLALYLYLGSSLGFFLRTACFLFGLFLRLLNL